MASGAPKGRTRTAKKPKKIAQTPDEKRQVRDAAHAANQATVLSGLGIDAAGQQALDALRSGQQPDPQAIARGGFEQAGLVEQASDGSYRMTASGRAALSAAQAGDAGRAGSIISSARDRTGAKQGRQAAAAERQQAAATRRAQVLSRREQAAAKKPKQAAHPTAAPAAAKKPLSVAKPAAPKRTPVPSAPALSAAPKKPAPKPDTAPAKQIAPALRDAAAAVSEGADVSAAQIQQLVTNGLIKLGKDGTPILTAAGQRATMKAETYGGTKRSNLEDSVFAGPDRSFPIKTAQDVKDAVRALGRTKHDKAAVRRGIIRRAKAIGATDALPDSWRVTTKAQTPSERAMFANMGSSGGGSGGGKATGGTGGLYPKGPSGKRTPQAGAAAAATPTKADAQQALQSHRKRNDEAKAKTSEVHKLEAQASQARRAGDTGRATELQDKADKLRAEAKKLDTRPDNISDMKIIGDAGFHMSNDGKRLIPSKHSTTPKIKEASFIVYKDHTGHHRWLARTTTAYRDRDAEIISSDALDADSLRMTAAKQFGPLRYWHVGQPDPLDATRPWGPGLDIGDCDYSTLIGRTRVESGTFRDAHIAQTIARQAERYELSPGFFHPLDQPDTGGVFHAIRTFERSIVPVRYGRASNLFTGLAVKEQRNMDIAEIEKRFKAAIVDLGLTAEQAQAFGQQLVQTEKDAAAQGIAFKSDDAPPAYPDIEINGVVYKAAPMPPMDAEDDPALGGDSGVDEAIEGESPIDEQPEGDYLGDMSWDEFAAKLSELLAPVLKVQDMHKGMMDAVGELKGMYGGVAQKDDARSQELIALKAQLSEVQQKIATIEGDQPATVLPDDVAAALKSAGPAKPAVPENPAIAEALNNPNRPFAWLGMHTFPELYNQNGANE